MEIINYMEKYDYEQLVFCQDKASGLKAIIAIHDTTLGPALGGTRMWPYSCEEDAIVDALRLARGMTYKNAAAGLNFGGGKTVIIGDPRKDKSEALFRAFGRFVESLNGRYITAEDVGICVEDMDLVNLETEHVNGVGASSGDPSPITAYGVLKGIQACAKEVWGTELLKGKTVALQGLGHVGYYLAKHLHEEGANLIVADINEQNVERVVRELGATAVNPDAIYGVDCDIFTPTALGAIINDQTIPQLKCRIIAGAANNQLAENRHGDLLHSKGILYAPDYIINAGGVINVADELHGAYNRERALKAVEIVYRNIEEIIAISKRDNIPTYKAADILAERRIDTLGKVRSTFLSTAR
jgi:leucine dehydrogenase